MKTGFLHGYPNKPGKKHYSYHGVKRDCLIQPDPDPFDEEPTYPPLGPEKIAYIKSFQAQGWYGVDLDYSTARNASNGIGPYPGIGQRINIYSLLYSVYRFGVLFDTAILPNDLLIVSASLIMDGITLLKGSRVWSVVIRHNEEIPHSTFTPSDYNFSNYSGNGGSAPASTGNYKRFELNSTGLSWIRPEGITRFCLVSTQDMAESPPPHDEFANYSGNPISHMIIVRYREYL